MKCKFIYYCIDSYKAKTSIHYLFGHLHDHSVQIPLTQLRIIHNINWVRYFCTGVAATCNVCYNTMHSCNLSTELYLMIDKTALFTLFNLHKGTYARFGQKLRFNHPWCQQRECLIYPIFSIADRMFNHHTMDFKMNSGSGNCHVNPHVLYVISQIMKCL